MTPGLGARVGLLSGVFGWLVAVIALLFSGREGLQAIRESVTRTAAAYPSPGAQQFLQMIGTPEGMATLVVLSIALMLVIVPGCGALGGAMGGALWRRRQDRPAKGEPRN